MIGRVEISLESSEETRSRRPGHLTSRCRLTTRPSHGWCTRSKRATAGPF